MNQECKEEVAVSANATAKDNMNINEASKACGLSPSVLRIWELRYGWPSPKRKSNGYRAYNQHQVGELKRVAELVKLGTPISALIIDGLPRWPADNTHKRVVTGLPKTRALKRARGVMESKIQEELTDSMERRHATHVLELIQRAAWSVRPDDEVNSSLVPTLMGLEEMVIAERPLAEDAQVRKLALDRCAQLMRRYRTDTPALWVVPAQADDVALATLVALILNQRGRPTQLWFDTSNRPTGAPYLIAGLTNPATLAQNDRRFAGRITATGGKDTNGKDILSLSDLLAAAAPLPTSAAPLSAN
jgi:DNA-binding transcriptional MerR regulator